MEFCVDSTNSRRTKGLVDTFYYYLEGEEGALAQSVPNPRDKTLEIPETPTQAERMKHMLTHCPYQPWCQHCVAGRSRGTLHKSVQIAGGGRFEADYTYYTSNGYEVVEANREEAVCVLTMRHRQSGAIFTTVVLRKGAWP